MKFTSTFSILTLCAIASSAKVFDALTIHSGSSVHLQGINQKDGALYVGGSGSPVQFVLNEADGSLSDVNTTQTIYENSNYEIVEAAEGQSSNFSLSNGVLQYNNKDFFACPLKDEYLLSTDCSDGTSIELKALDVTDVDVGFGVLSIHSGSQFQYANINKDSSKPQTFFVGGELGSPVNFTLKADGTLYEGTQAINVDSNNVVGDIAPNGRVSPSSDFSIQQNHLAYQNSTNFYACPSGDDYVLATECEDGTAISLLVSGKSYSAVA